MNFDDVTSLILKIFKSPVSVLCVGLAVYFFAPQEHRWISWIIMAWGVGALLEILIKKLLSYWCDIRDIKDNLKELSQKEKVILLECLIKSERTVYLVIHDFMLTHTMLEFTALRAHWKGLHQKKIVTIEEIDRGVWTITIKPRAWKVLVKMHRRNPSYFDTST